VSESWCESHRKYVDALCIVYVVSCVYIYILCLCICLCEVGMCVWDVCLGECVAESMYVHYV